MCKTPHWWNYAQSFCADHGSQMAVFDTYEKFVDVLVIAGW